MSALARFMEKLNLPEGFSESRLPGVRYFRQNHPVERTPLLYDPGLCIVTQGHKIAYLGDRQLEYNPDNYLVVPVSIQFECETCATPDHPLLGLYIDIDMPHLHELVSRIAPPAHSPTARRSLPMAPAPMDEPMGDATLRLLKCLQSDTETRILSAGIVKEILYRALTGTQASMLYALATHNSSFSNIARALRLIQTKYATKLDVETLAHEARMSPSAFHRAFKETTSESPLQYLKKVRLTKARDLMFQENMKAYIAANEVGYESASQFSREFKRYFGQSPAAMVETLRTK